MRTKQTHIVISLILAAIVFFGGIGVNIVHYCCHACEQDGIESVLSEMCEQEHKKENNSCCAELHDTTIGTSCASSQLDQHDRCSLTRIQFAFENELNNLSHNLVVSLYLLPVVSLFKVTERPASQPYYPSVTAYNSRHLLSLFSVLLI